MRVFQLLLSEKEEGLETQHSDIINHACHGNAKCKILTFQVGSISNPIIITSILG